MTSYSAHWRTTIFAAIILHFFIALGVSYVLPILMPEPKIEIAPEFEWVDVDLLPDNFVVAEEAIPAETAQENSPTFNAQDLFIPELTIPEVKIEPPAPIKPPEIKPIERPKPKVENPKPPAQIQPEEKPPEVPAKTDDADSPKQQLGKPPVTVKEVYPEKDSVLGYKGYVVVAVTIGKDGKVKAANIVSSSGTDSVDEIALKAAKQWTFRPALDKIGKPMACDKIITFDFKKISDAK